MVYKSHFLLKLRSSSLLIMEFEKGFCLTIVAWKNYSKTWWFKQFAQEVFLFHVNWLG